MGISELDLYLNGGHPKILERSGSIYEQPPSHLIGEKGRWCERKIRIVLRERVNTILVNSPPWFAEGRGKGGKSSKGYLRVRAKVNRCSAAAQ